VALRARTEVVRQYLHGQHVEPRGQELTDDMGNARPGGMRDVDESQGSWSIRQGPAAKGEIMIARATRRRRADLLRWKERLCTHGPPAKFLVDNDFGANEKVKSSV